MLAGCFVSCAKRALLQCQLPFIVIPLRELNEWQAKFGTLEHKTLEGEGCAVSMLNVGQYAWGSMACHCVIDSSTPEAEGPRALDEHGPANRRTWALFTGKTIMYKSVQHKGRVTTELSWYGQGGYDPSNPGISAQERARIAYDPEFPDIELL